MYPTKIMKTSLSLLLAFFLGLATLQADTWQIDGAHSNITFKIQHLFLAKVTGNFSSFTGTIEYDPEAPERSSAEVTIQIASIDTDNAQRDDHLNTDDFFNSPKYPVATFKSTSWEKTGEKSFRVMGDLTMMGQTHPVTLQTELIGVVETERGMKSGWEATTTLDRYTWGIGGEGGAQIGRKVDIEINVEAAKTQ